MATAYGFLLKVTSSCGYIYGTVKGLSMLDNNGKNTLQYFDEKRWFMGAVSYSVGGFSGSVAGFVIGASSPIIVPIYLYRRYLKN